MSSSLVIDLVPLPHAQDLPLPAYASAGSAGVDLHAAITDDLTIMPGTWQKIPTGIQIALPHGYEGQIRSRSGLSSKHGVVVLNSPGTIDSDYRGEIIALIMNHGSTPFVINRGMRIAQFVISPIAIVSWRSCHSLEETVRGIKGWGSSGI